jgi:cell division transport system permease protein
MEKLFATLTWEPTKHMLRNLGYYIWEALISIRRSGMSIVLSVAIITVSLIVFGLFLLISSNVNNLTDFISSKLEIRIYLKNDITKKEIKDFRSRISRMAHVKEVIFIDKDTAWNKFKSNFRNLDLSDMIDNNPLPHSFRVYLSDNSQTDKLSTYLKNGFSKYVEDIGQMSNVASKISLFSRFTRIGGLTLVILLTLATLLIIINTIRLTVIARQDEITIMQLVGATNSFIKIPFIIEGGIMGSVASILAFAFLKVGYLFVALKIQEQLPFFPIVFDPMLLNKIYVIVILFGVSLGFIGAYLSVTKSLKISL